MSTSAAMAGIATSQAAIASAEAHAAKVSMCKAMMPAFNAQTATVEQMQEYADCVDTLYPSQLAPGSVIFLKFLFVLAIVGCGIGLWKARKAPFRGAEDFVMYGLLGTFCLPLAAVCLGGVIAGFIWLFS